MTNILGNNSNEEAGSDHVTEYDMNYWCDELNLKADELAEIVKTVGPHLHDIRMHIAKKHILQWPVSY